MCNQSCITFGTAHLSDNEISAKEVLEVGAADHNGTLRDYVESLGPRRYWGVDILDAPGVDEVCSAENLVQRFGAESFDVVICTEVLEHIRDWRVVVSNLKRVVKPDGIVLITTRSRGFAYHRDPQDYWRYEVADFRTIFSDFKIEALERDPQHAGVFLKARKPEDFREADCESLKLYSILKRRRIFDIRDDEISPLLIKLNTFDTKCRVFLCSILPVSWREFLKKRVLRIT